MRCTRATGLNAGNGGTLAASVLPVGAVPVDAVSMGEVSEVAVSRPESGGTGSAGTSTGSLGFVDEEMTEQAGKPIRQARSAARA